MKSGRFFVCCLLIGLLVTAVSCQESDAETIVTKDNGTDNTASETNEPLLATTSEVEPETEPAPAAIDPAPGETSSNSHEQVERTIITFAVDSWEVGVYEELVTRFEEDNPDIKVEIVAADELTSGEQDAAIVSSSPYVDNFLLTLVQKADVVSTRIEPTLVPDGMLLNLEPLMNNDDNFNSTDYFPGALEKYQWRGGTWALPVSINYMVMLYDKDLFDRAGVAYPEVGWSWDDFLTIAQATTLREGAEVTQWGFSTHFSEPFVLVQAQVGSVFDFTDSPPTVRLEDPDVVTAHQWLASLYTEYEVMPSPFTFDGDINYDALIMAEKEKNVAMWLADLDSFAWSSGERNLGIVPFPVTADNPYSSPLGQDSSVLAISAGTLHPQEAWTWIEFLTQQEGDGPPYWGEGRLGVLPARRSVAEVSGVWDLMDEEVAMVARFASEHSFVPDDVGAGSEIFHEILPAIVADGADIGLVLAGAQQAFGQEAVERISQGDGVALVPPFTVAAPLSAQLEAGDIVVNFFATTGSSATYRVLAEEFHELHPDIVVRIHDPGAYGGEASVKAVAVEADAFDWWGTITTEEDLALVLPVQPLLNADADLTEADFFPAVFDQFRINGQVIGLPAQVQVPFLHYNKRLFDAAGVNYPEPGWTMDAFLQTAVALTRGEGEDEKVYGFTSDIYGLQGLEDFLSLQNVKLIDDSVDPPRTDFTSPHTISAMRWYTNLTTEYGVNPVYDIDSFDTGGANHQERLSLIENDRVALWNADPYADPFADRMAHIGVVPYPIGDSGTHAFTSVTGYYISADTQVREATWEWLKYLTTQDVGQHFVSARISTAESNAFAARVGAENADAWVTSLQQSVRGSFYSDYLQDLSSLMHHVARIAMDKAYRDIVDGELSVEEALQKAQDKVDIYRECIIDHGLLDTEDAAAATICMEAIDF